MTMVEKKIRYVRWRLEWLNFCRRFVRLLLVALILLTGYVIAGKFAKLPYAFWTVAPYVLTSSIPLALVWAVATRTNRRNAAIATDQQLALRERLSTALVLGRPKNAMEAAVLADAEEHARPIRARRVFPMPIWGEVYAMPLLVAIMLVVGMFIPNIRVLASADEKKPEQGEAALPTKAQEQLARRLEAFQRKLETGATSAPLGMRMREVSTDMEKFFRDLKERRAMSQADVMKELSKLEDKIAQRRDQMEKEVESTRDLEDVAKTTGEETKTVADAMAKGNFNKAGDELTKLAEKLQKGELSKDQMDKLAADLQKMSQALKDNPELAKALAQAAQNLKAGQMGKAGQNLNLSAQQMQSLAETMKQMQQLAQAQKMMQAMKAMQQCQGCNSSSCTACMSFQQLAAILGESGFKPGESERFGPGMGGPGHGQGGKAPFQNTPIKFQPTQPQSNLTQGDIIGALRVWGPQIRGEANTKYQDAYIEYSQSAEDTMSRENIPLEYRSLVKQYFDAIRPATMARDDTVNAQPEKE
jgi:tetratricopeptide (TPR) repeat protein